MSWQAASWASRQTVGDQPAKHLLLVLANYAGDDNLTRPSYETLIEATEMSRATVYRKVRYLVEKGLITTTSIPGGTTLYRLMVGSQAETPPSQDETPPVSAVRPMKRKPLVRKPTVSSREPDPIWDTVVDAYGPPANSNERGRLNKAVKLLKEAQATPEDIRLRRRRWDQVFPGATPTALGLANNWTTLAPNRPRLAVVKADVCADCEVGGGQHTADCPTFLAWAERVM